jgi:AraC-like DNA-binding protein
VTKTATISQQPLTPLERLKGIAAQSMQRTALLQHRDIYAEYIHVGFNELDWTDEHAKLYLYPVADGQFCLQLIYLQHTDQPDTAEVMWIEYKPTFFEQYPLSVLANEEPFKVDHVTERQFAICNQSVSLLDSLHEPKGDTEFIQTLQQTETLIHLLRRALECIKVPFTVCPVPACRFLANDYEREKVIEACKVVEQHFDRPLTIKELSRKVAMNECYLKKGFKALTGKTIHEYTQDLRITKAKEMLKQEGLSVSDVANTLGFSSISHFSTAFKKATGMKPCELLA